MMPFDPQRLAYGEHPDQYAELTLPEDDEGDAVRSGNVPSGNVTSRKAGGVVVIIHGGYWRSRYTAELGRPAARDLAARGYACWNLEYRRAGNGGGWPETFEDISAGIDALEPAAQKHGLDLERVTVLGHSAGGHLAVWAAGRTEAAVPVTAVVSQAGVLNLAEALELNLSDGAVRNFLGSSPDADPHRYRSADPMQRLPLAVPVTALHGDSDKNVPLSQSAGFVQAAVDAGSPAELRMVPGDHFDLITPGTQAWAAVVEAVADASELRAT
ncbi:alpha/beta hydrolase family protein [Arthrobacter gengyunqii]|uniref:S9 family peptidase n=1 Tax=Arthrobacter gengyunqii TaxID=2886940 RepID=A0ABS8GHT5_9MICC|nr:alpha/beta fold hydrolase [Arthrobacter gengyunqii]MCC3266187.1 S9 family peptidase [Arthrobacter gengyunqii]